MEKCKDRTKTPMKPKRTTLETIDHYAGIGVLVLFGSLMLGIASMVVYNLPPHSLW